MSALTANAISGILANQQGLQPTLQILDIKGIQANKQGAPQAGPQRFRLTVSDGTKHMQAMIATQKNQMVQSGEIREHSVIRLKEFMTNDLKGTPVLILLEFDVVTFVDHVIGNPVAATDGPAAAAPTPYGQNAGASAYPNPAARTAAPTPAASPYGNPAATAPNAYGSAPQAPKPTPYASAAPASAPYGGAPYGGAPASTPYGAPSSSHGASPYGGNQQTQYGSNQPYGNFSNNRPVMRDEGVVSVMPISELHPYANRWTIKARVTSKSPLKRWSNARGEGTLFSVDLLDKDGGEVRATFFKDACDKFYDLLEEGRVYFFGQGKLKVANKQYTSITHNYEITFDVNAEIRLAGEDTDISAVRYHFKKIADLKDCAPGQTVDVLGVVKHATDVQELISTKRGGVQLFKRDLTLMDDSNHEIKLTLWGDKAQEDLGWSAQPILGIKCARVSAYSGVSIETVQSSNVKVNPELPEAHALYRWLQEHGLQGAVSLTVGGSDRGGGSFQQRKTISVIKEENLGFNEKPDYLSFKATINYIKHDNEPWYTACPTEGCNKKVSETMDNSWFCEKCNQAFPTCHRRYILSLTVSDYTGTAWVTCFNEQARELLEADADYLHEMKQTGNEQGYEAVFEAALFKTFVMRARVKAEQVNDEARVKTSLSSLSKVDFVSESRSLISAIEGML